MTKPGLFIPYCPPRMTPDDMRSAAEFYWERMNGRRSVRDFSADPVPQELIALAIQTASTAPSGAHRQPWKFVAMSHPKIKRQIREAAEKEEYESYEGGRMPESWRAALAPLGTDWRKPYLETVPWIVVVFEEVYRVRPDGSQEKNYYVKESVGIACGMFIAALHTMGLATLTHTPSPMGFLSRISCTARPMKGRLSCFPIGYPADHAQVPDIQRKSLTDVVEWFVQDHGYAQI